jgi:putative FmdB family regulatory protein
MPVYEYRCPDCTHLFEKLVSFSEASRGVSCPTCGTQANKLLSTFAAIGTAGGSSSEAGAPMMSAGGGGCCGGGCCGGN